MLFQNLIDRLPCALPSELCARLPFELPFGGLFNEKIEPQCGYCLRGKAIDPETVLCRKRGVTAPESSCSAFRYDPLKRVPPSSVAPNFSRLDEEDFSL